MGNRTAHDGTSAEATKCRPVEIRSATSTAAPLTKIAVALCGAVSRIGRAGAGRQRDAVHLEDMVGDASDVERSPGWPPAT